MEYFDILDEKGNELGITKRRAEVHAEGYWHAAVNIWLLNSQKEILIQKRSAIKNAFPEKWDISCAGHIQAGDTASLTAIRELEEELGIKVKEEELEFLKVIKEQLDLNNHTYIDNELRSIFLLQKDLNINDLTLQTAEVTEVKWIPLKDFERFVSSPKNNFVPHPTEFPVILPLLKNRFLS